MVDGAACAVELIHAYSLVHDDLPAMDDDDLRRGRPTCHKAFDEATAILVGDALQVLAFEILADGPGLAATTPRSGCSWCSCSPIASGTAGMAGGQALDLAAMGRTALGRRSRRDARPQDRRADSRQRDDGRGLRRRAGR